MVEDVWQTHERKGRGREKSPIGKQNTDYDSEGAKVASGGTRVGQKSEMEKSQKERVNEVSINPF
jgi:hypothetical protein